MSQNLNPVAIRRHILEHSKRANVGHIGSCLGIVELLAAVFRVMNRPSQTDPDRDRFILSKGHAALALYGALVEAGVLSDEELNGFFVEGSPFGVHPEHVIKGVDFSTGSLGQGLGVGAGAALAAKVQNSARQVYVIMSDAELNEGSTWEAVQFSGHHGLDNLTALLDANGQQAFGYTHEVVGLEPLAPKWESFGWEVMETDGHDLTALHQALTAPRQGKPRLVLGRTVFGKGVSYMEGQIPWHYLPMNDEQYQQALQDIQR